MAWFYVPEPMILGTSEDLYKADAEKFPEAKFPKTRPKSIDDATDAAIVEIVKNTKAPLTRLWLRPANEYEKGCGETFVVLISGKFDSEDQRLHTKIEITRKLDRLIKKLGPLTIVYDDRELMPNCKDLDFVCTEPNWKRSEES